MRVKIGEVLTLQTDVDVQYQCSACGKENLHKQPIKANGETSSIFGINLNRKMHVQAQDALKRKLVTVLNPNDPLRFREAAFRCSCNYFQHREPWARMNYESLDKKRPSFLLLACLTLFLSFILAMNAISQDLLQDPNFLVLCLVIWGISLFCAAIPVFVWLYKKKNTQKREQQTAQLPAESIPVIYLHSKERHDAFREALSYRNSGKKTAATAAVYSTWTCRECGTQNSAQYAQCKKCGKFKAP